MGGGPAGSAFAREFSSNSKKTILVLEESKKMGFPNKSTSGFVPHELEELEIPKSLWGWKTSAISLENGGGFSAKLDFEMFVSDYTSIVNSVLGSAIGNGTQVKLGSRALSISKNSVKYSSEGVEKEVLADFIVDAAGPMSKFASVRKILPKKRLGLGFDARVSEVSLERPREMVFNFNSQFSPGGYSWIFPTSEKTARVGNCWFSEAKKKFPARDGTHKELYSLWAKGDSRLASAKILEESGGVAYMEDSKRRVFGNYVAIGDSASTCRPPFGLGIAPAMKAGRLAAKILSEKSNFSGFDREMNRVEGWKNAVNSISEAFYCLPEKRMNSFLLKLSKIEKERASRFLALDFGLGKDFKILSSLAKELLF